MVSSAFTAPHVTEWVTVDVTRTMELVERLRRGASLRDVKVAPLLVLARAVILAMRRTPEINSFWDDGARRRSSTSTTSTSASPPPRRAAWSCPTSRTPDRCACAELARGARRR